MTKIWLGGSKIYTISEKSVIKLARLGKTIIFRQHQVGFGEYINSILISSSCS